MRIFILLLCALFPLFASAQATHVANAAGVDLFAMLENGGQSMAFLVAMYWLKDSHSRRIEEAKEYAALLLESKTRDKEELLRLYAAVSEEHHETQKQITVLQDKIFEWIRQGHVS